MEDAAVSKGPKGLIHRCRKELQKTLPLTANGGDKPIAKKVEDAQPVKSTLKAPTSHPRDWTAHDMHVLAQKAYENGDVKFCKDMQKRAYDHGSVEVHAIWQKVHRLLLLEQSQESETKNSWLSGPNAIKDDMAGFKVLPRHTKLIPSC